MIGALLNLSRRYHHWNVSLDSCPRTEPAGAFKLPSRRPPHCSTHAMGAPCPTSLLLITVTTGLRA